MVPLLLYYTIIVRPDRQNQERHKRSELDPGGNEQNGLDPFGVLSLYGPTARIVFKDQELGPIIESAR